MDLWVTGMPCGSSALEKSRSRDKEAKDNLGLRNWLAVLKNKEEMQTETEDNAIGKTI